MAETNQSLRNRLVDAQNRERTALARVAVLDGIVAAKDLEIQTLTGRLAEAHEQLDTVHQLTLVSPTVDHPCPVCAGETIPVTLQLYGIGTEVRCRRCLTCPGQPLFGWGPAL